MPIPKIIKNNCNFTIFNRTLVIGDMISYEMRRRYEVAFDDAVMKG
jgi:hypothetical protein